MAKMRMALLLLALLSGLTLPTAAQQAQVPSVTVSDQVSVDGTVTVASAYSEGPGFVVIHIQQADGTPGPVAGVGAVNPGWSYNIRIAIDNTIITPTLFAMLHKDDNVAGLYEFGTVEGADAPVAVNGNVVTPPFKIEAITPTDQFVAADGSVTIAAVTTQVNGWLVIHSQRDGTFGPVLGQTQVPAGTSLNVSVALAADGRTSVLWPMLHVDTGTPGQYEFGAVEGADGPVAIDGVVATMPIWTVPHMRVADQIVVRGDGQPATDIAPTLVAASVLLDTPGFLVVHQEQDGTFGPVAGVSEALPIGLSTNVTVTLDPQMLTPRLWPMLHVDTGTPGQYEFGAVEGADAPVAVDGNVVTYAIDAAPSIVYAGGLTDGVLSVEQALIDAPGWLAIHSNNNGQPGPVLATYPLVRGVNPGIQVQISSDAAGSLVFPMLHYDTNVLGQYEFGAVEGADGPVFVREAVVVGPLNLGGEAAAPAPVTGCTVTPAGGGAVNIRSGSSTSFSALGSLAPGESADVVGRTDAGGNGLFWWSLANGGWVRSDVVTASDGCDAVPVVEASASPAQPADPAATQEASS